MIGIMTFHAAYNFGSSFQAYATQHVINSLGYECEIINYRLPNQIHYYGDLFTTKFGEKDSIRRLFCLQEIRARKIRAARYERFIKDKLKLSDKEVHSYSELNNAGFEYSTLVAGSDQVWNEHCTAEFKTEPADSILGYFLDFEKERPVKRISFSSSLGSMNENEINKYKHLLERFSDLSIREKDGALMIGNMLNKTVTNTVDPTLLLSRQEWLEAFQSELEPKKNDYILLYTLQKSYRNLIKIQNNVSAFANGRTVICLSPFLASLNGKVRMRNDSGPIEFLSLLSNADCMITDSFHGTAFSVNLGIPFYTINSGRDDRKRQMLERVGLEDQLIMSSDELKQKSIPVIDFGNAWTKLDQIRAESTEYLRNALKG